jgi:uncharacterized protein (DUF1778 family)
MAKIKITENRDQLVKEQRLEIRLSKVQKDGLQELAKKRQTTITNLIVTALIPKLK